jgi:nucleotide-binding universal stress UspA family protein
MYKKILVPLDGSKLAEQILPHVKTIAKATGGRAILVRAVPVHAEFLLEAPSESKKWVKAAEARAGKYLEGVAKGLEKAGLKTKVDVLPGEPAEQILSAAEKENVELIAMMSHGETGLSAFDRGSVAEKVIKHSTRPVLMVRAFHHFNRFEEEGGFRTAALADAMAMLKPGGIVGVVQHRAPEANSDKWAEGDNGYVKQSEIIKAFEGAGFEFVGSSEVNANPADKPTEADIVWRLPPTLGTSRKDPALKAQMEAIGESDRMTLKFRKPE